MQNEQILLWAGLIAAGYLLGSCMFSLWLPLLLLNRNVHVESDDGCPGAANVFKLCSWRLGLLCLLLDMGKGFLPVYLGIRFCDPQDWLFALLMLTPVLGHAWSVFWKFQGGKCIATIFGEMIALMWVTPIGLVLCGLYLYFSAVVVVTPNMKRSILVFSLFALFSFVLETVFSRYSIGLGCLLISIIAVWKHLPPAQKRPVRAKVKDSPAADDVQIPLVSAP